ncbi:methylaspartate mutase subunit S [Leisingera sp. ANG-M1]|uniref:methylaspartate mutase subunit S n=1 Tax=Leisingera sp. ANG-M1 TaxID=1577895 RepID=UPI00068A80C8|nr:methylaspartate mutase subunit S [Leisingera sp. ANG-M1]
MTGWHENFNAVLGVSGDDCPVIGCGVIRRRLEQNGIRVTSLEGAASKEKLVSVAKQNGADAILISSNYGFGEPMCRGLRALCDENGLKGITLYAGGNLMAASAQFPDVEQRFRAMGYDRVFPPLVSLALVAEQLKEDIRRKRRFLKGRIAGPARLPERASPAGLSQAFAHMYG